jgi:hypothetical protein
MATSTATVPFKKVCNSDDEALLKPKADTRPLLNPNMAIQHIITADRSNEETYLRSIEHNILAEYNCQLQEAKVERMYGVPACTVIESKSSHSPGGKATLLTDLVMLEPAAAVAARGWWGNDGYYYYEGEGEGDGSTMLRISKKKLKAGKKATPSTRTGDSTDVDDADRGGGGFFEFQDLDEHLLVYRGRLCIGRLQWGSGGVSLLLEQGVMWQWHPLPVYSVDWHSYEESPPFDLHFLYDLGYIGATVTELACCKHFQEVIRSGRGHNPLLRAIADPCLRRPALYRTPMALELAPESMPVPINEGQLAALSGLKYEIEAIQGPPGK